MSSAPLQQLLRREGEKPLSGDEVLSRFIDYTSSKKLELYPAQEEAVLELLGGKHVVLATPTGSGKSLVALAFHFMALCEGKTSFYTCPIKALVNEKFFALCEAFGAENVGLMTGDASVNKSAKIICCTAEILSNLCLREERLFADCVVMDEFHYYGDKERGVAWQVPLISMAETQFLLMSATLGDMTEINQSLKELTHREMAEVRSALRPVPLEFSYLETPLHETIQSLLTVGKAPVYLVNFSQRAAAEQAQNLMSVDFSTKEDKEKLKAALEGFSFDTPFGKEMSKLLRHGIGLHHAGLLPKYRLLVERLAQSGLLKVISGTDTLGVGVNIPIRTVLFTQLCKFDGEKSTILAVRDFHQIAGRAGRKGFDSKGDVVVQAPAHVIENLGLSQKKAAGKKVVMQKPPTKGYVHWDRATFDRLVTKDPEALTPQFSVHHGMLINLLQAGEETRQGGYRKLMRLIETSHTSVVLKNKLRRQSAVFFRTLRAAGIVALGPRTPTSPAIVRVAPGLQKDFSLHHTLSMYLIETLPKLDPASENYALDVLSLVEAILENPDVVLYSQLSKLKDEKIQQWKAEGMEYDQRMEELEKLEWPKPNREFTYGTFNAFSLKHPWVGQENIRPKSIAREMFETVAGFNAYIQDYGLQRSEGVLLRYLSEAYKTLSQNVPEASRNDTMEEILEYLRATIEGVDTSLIDEWGRLLQGHPQKVEPKNVERAVHLEDWSKNPRKVTARIRNEVQQLVRLVAQKKYAEFTERLANGSEWSETQLETLFVKYWETHSNIDTSTISRHPKWLRIEAAGDSGFEVSQMLLFQGEPSDFVIDFNARIEVKDGAPRLQIELVRLVG